MNEQKQENQVQQDSERVKKDLNTLITNRVSQMADGLEKLTGNAKDSVADAAETVKKDVGLRLSQYNSKAQEVAEKIPGGFVEKTTKYPWVAISIAVGVGFLLGNLLKPSRQIFR